MVVFISTCSPQPEITGRWRSTSPSKFLYEYRSDGTVLLHLGQPARQVFRYQLLDSDSLRLYDGMGRFQDYDFLVSRDQLSFFDAGNDGILVEKFTRE